MPREKKTKAPKTTAQRLDSVIKSARNKMRKDRELKTDLTRLPTLTWLMFLKFVDDMERVHEDEAVLAGEPYRNLIGGAIGPPIPEELPDPICSPSSMASGRFEVMARKVRGCSPICEACAATAKDGSVAMSCPRSFAIFGTTRPAAMYSGT